MRLVLYLKVYLLRFASAINALIDRRFISPVPAGPSFTRRVPTRRAPRAGEMTLYFYAAPSYRPGAAPPGRARPLVINFHGGGFTVGHATDDARLAAAVVAANPEAVFVSAGYRKAPRHPAPTAAQDAADAIEWLWEHAAALGLDAGRTVTMGSSAGGNLSLAAPLLVHQAAQAAAAGQAGVRWGPAGCIRGAVAIYPSVDNTIARADKAARNSASVTHGTVSPALYGMFDEAYYTAALPPARRGGVATSPGLAGDAATAAGLPDRVAVYTCEWDQLLAEGEAFRAKLKAAGKAVGGYTVDKAPHAFDKDVRKRSQFRAEVDRLYEDAGREVSRMVGTGGE